MDSWSDAQVNFMEAGGNESTNAFLEARGVPPGTEIWRKYNSPAAQLYREVLRARAEGSPVPQHELSPEEFGAATPQAASQQPAETPAPSAADDTVSQLQASFSKLGEAASEAANSAASRAYSLARYGTEELRQNSERLSDVGASAARRTGEYAERGWNSLRGWLKTAQQSLDDWGADLTSSWNTQRQNHDNGAEKR